MMVWKETKRNSYRRGCLHNKTSFTNRQKRRLPKRYNLRQKESSPTSS
jgi:hypothetical protein